LYEAAVAPLIGAQPPLDGDDVGRDEQQLAGIA